MSKKIVPLLLGFLCSKLFIKLFPIDIPFDFSEWLLTFVLNPFEFFIASLFFIMSFMMHAVIMEDGIKQIALYVYRKRVEMGELLFILLLLLSFTILSLSGFWQAMIIFCFSLLYGIISVDFKRLKIIED